MKEKNERPLGADEIFYDENISEYLKCNFGETKDILPGTVTYEPALFHIYRLLPLRIFTAVHNRPVRMELQPEKEGFLLTVRVDDPVPFRIEVTLPENKSRGPETFINGRENDGYSFSDGIWAIERVFSGKTVIKVKW